MRGKHTASSLNKKQYTESESSSTKHQTGALSLLYISINKSFPSINFY